MVFSESKNLNDNFEMNIGKLNLFPLIYHINLSLHAQGLHILIGNMFPCSHYIGISVTVTAADRDFPVLVCSLITTGDTDLAKYDIIPWCSSLSMFETWQLNAPARYLLQVLGKIVLGYLHSHVCG